MQEKKHEPAPWILGGCSGRMITTPSGYYGDGFIADVDTKANAEFIVKACNSYDDMLRALQLAKDIMTTYNLMKSKAGYEIESAIEKATK